MVLVASVIGAAVMYMLLAHMSPSSSGDTAQQVKISSMLLNSTIFTDSQKDFIINFTPLRDQINSIRKKYPEKTYVYFDYLNNAVWVGMNERTSFAAASTIKVPLAMEIYRMTEEGKLKMSDTYTLDQLDLDQNFGTLYKVGENHAFSVEELMKIMLEQSDNTAMQALLTVTKRIGVVDPFGDVYTYMGWNTDPMNGFTDLGVPPNYLNIDLKTLSRMFLSLYNADYDNIEHSQQILQYLTQSPFTNEIVAGVPKGVPVAHKIGVWEPSGEPPTYSDCGIVYAPNRNYILCLATIGIDRVSSNTFMAEVSKAAYDYVINH